VYVVDDDQAFRDSMRWLLESAGYRVALYATADHFLATCVPEPGSCAVLDVRMPGLSGLELQEEILRRGYALPLIFVTGHGDVPVAVNAIKRGAVDFIEKPFKDSDLLALVQGALQFDGKASEGRTRQHSAAARLSALTRREREVMEGVVAGKSNKVIAEELGISVRTVETHRASVMVKTGAASLPDLVQLAYDARA
jgi:FixJ family two-component response regulator